MMKKSQGRALIGHLGSHALLYDQQGCDWQPQQNHVVGEEKDFKPEGMLFAEEQAAIE